MLSINFVCNWTPLYCARSICRALETNCEATRKHLSDRISHFDANSSDIYKKLFETMSLADFLYVPVLPSTKLTFYFLVI